MDASFTYVRRIIPQANTSFLVPPFPLAGSAIDLWFANGQYYDGGTVADPTGNLSVSRASIGYVKNSDGTLTQFGNDTLRIGVGTGLLIEDTRTNNVQRSQEISNVYWGSLNYASITDNQTAAPDGTTTGAKIIPDNTFAEHYINKTVTSITGATLSVYMKAAEYNFGYVSFGTGADFYSVEVNLTTGEIVKTFVNGSPTGAVTFIEPMANGWYRFGVSLTSTTTAITFGACNAVISDVNWNAFGAPSFTGTGTSGVYVWGVQYEAGSFASSYMPTTTAAAARAADAVSCIGNLFTFLSATEASVVADILGNTTPFNAGGGWGYIASDVGNLAVLSSQSPSDILIDYHDGSGVGLTANVSPHTVTGGVKMGASWKEATPVRSIVGGGGTVATDASVNGLAPVNPVLGNYTSGYMYGFFRRLSVWTARLSDSTLQGFTA